MHPERFGPFRIERKLPGGSMGLVYKAVDTRDNILVALKVIDIGADPDSQDIVTAERLGAILQARLCVLDPRVTMIREYGELNGYFYIAMEFVEGEDLSIFVRRGIEPRFAARIAKDICEALHQAHTFRGEIEGKQYAGIVHGDIKPRNVRIDTKGCVKVLDFGIAKALSLTRGATRNPFRSSQYSSRERLRTGNVDAHSDLWSVAVVLYELVAKQPYFNEPNLEKQEHLIKNYAVLQPLPEDVPEGLRRILARALAPLEGARYQSAREFADALGAFLEGKTIADPRDFDGEATRRTDREAETSRSAPTAETRKTRTVPPKLPARPAVSAPGPVRLVKLLAAGFFFVLFVYYIYREIDTGRESSQLARELHSEQLRDMNAAWARYQEIAGQSLFGFTTSDSRDALKSRLLAQTDAVIEGYRNSDGGNSTEAGWLAAQAGAQRVLTLFPGDNAVRGRLRLAQGHLDRIRSGKESKLLNQARERFEEAAKLLPKSPDPQLGLARLYAYHFRDVERTEEAIAKLEDLGFRPGKREKAQMADVYRDRAGRMYREAVRSRDRSEEGDYLDRAQRDYERARELYEQIIDFGDVSGNLRRVSDAIEQIDLRRDELKAEN